MTPEFMALLDELEALAGKLSRLNPEEARAALAFLESETENYRGALPSNVIELEKRRK